MGTFIKAIVVLYILYYCGNIIYDLFFKKDRLPQEQEDKTEFSLGDIETINATNVNMDQVEEIQTTSSMEIQEDELFSDSTQTSDSDTDLEVLKRKFEEENKLDELVSAEPKDNVDSDKENFGGRDIPVEQLNNNSNEIIDKEKILEQNRKKFRNMLNLAETSIQVVRIGDTKVFKSTL